MFYKLFPVSFSVTFSIAVTNIAHISAECNYFV